MNKLPRLTRRNFIKATGAIAAAVGVGAGVEGVRASQVLPEHGERLQQGGMSADEMDAMHEKGVKDFVANIGKDPGFWGVPMKFEMDGDVKVFNITATEGDWETSPGVKIPAMMYNGRVPGEVIRVTEGDKIRVIVNNKMTQSTAVHFHGVHMPNSMDGVPYITQPPIKPGATFNYEFTVKPEGSHMYHSHHNSTEQVTRGLLGAFIVDPKDASKQVRVDNDYVMVLNDSSIGLTINGKGFPATQPIIAKVGERIRVRYYNEGLMIHPFHLHGMYQTVIAKDGAPLATPYLADTLNIAPGERYDVLVDCIEPGIWAYHCHILSHAEGPTGMFGMVTALVIK